MFCAPWFTFSSYLHWQLALVTVNDAKSLLWSTALSVKIHPRRLLVLQRWQNARKIWQDSGRSAQNRMQGMSWEPRKKPRSINRRSALFVRNHIHCIRLSWIWKLITEMSLQDSYHVKFFIGWFVSLGVYQVAPDIRKMKLTCRSSTISISRAFGLWRSW